METDARTLAGVLGARVRQARLGRSWTLDQLAEASGVSRRVLVTVEQGGSNPSLTTLLRISDALGVGLPALVEPPQRAGLVKLTKAGEGAVLWSSEVGGLAVLLGGSAAPDVLELWDWTLGAHDRHESEAHAPGTQEIMLVQQGTVVVETAGDSVRLGPGDTLTFRGDSGHAYRNPDPETARFVLTVFEPDVGSGSRSKEHHV